jgi:amidase
MGARELAAAIRSKQASSEEAIVAHLRRIEAVNSSLNAVTVVLADAAVMAAKSADRAVAAGDENIDLAGTPTTQGVPALVGAVPEIDAPHVERLRSAYGSAPQRQRGTRSAMTVSMADPPVP